MYNCRLRAKLTSRRLAKQRCLFCCSLSLGHFKSYTFFLALSRFKKGSQREEVLFLLYLVSATNGTKTVDDTERLTGPAKNDGGKAMHIVVEGTTESHLEIHTASLD